jgi:hypothetical protein
MSRILKLCGSACAGLMCVTSQASARIMCDGNFQIVDGASVSTPYCQDENLAANLRSRGVKVTGGEVRHRAELKREACASASYANETACSAEVND